MEKRSLLHSHDETESSLGFRDSLSERSDDRPFLEPVRRRRWCTAIWIHALLIAINCFATFSVVNYFHDKYSHGANVRYTPARSALVYEPHEFDLRSIYLPNGSMNPAKTPNLLGDPSPELDANWGELLQYTNIRLTKEELGEFGNDESLAELSDGSGYFAGVMAYHALHCVQQIHHWLHKDYYFQNLTDDEATRQTGHIAHCLDTLRQSIQCQGDTTVFPLYWGESQRIPMGKGNTGKHECVNWNTLDGWMEDHSFDPLTPGLMIHPTLGPAFSPHKPGDERIGFGSDKKLEHEHEHVHIHIGA